MINKIIRYFLENRVITILLLTLVVVWEFLLRPLTGMGDCAAKPDSCGCYPRYR